MKNEFMLLFIIIIAALVSRIYISSIFYGQSSDEFANIFLVRSTFDSGFRGYPHLFMWFYYFMSGLLLFIINDALLAPKIVTILFGTASIFLAYSVAKKLFGEKEALLSCFLLAINPEFTIISSAPLREPVYTFFILLSVLLLINNRIFSGAFSVGMAFLTRMEGLLIGMPYYIIAGLNQKTKKKTLKISIILTIFVLFILFMNLWVSEPFLYLTDTFKNQIYEQPKNTLFFYEGLIPLIVRIYKSLSIFLGYSFALIGPNIIFLGLGAYFLFKDRKNSFIYRVFMLCLASHMIFWLGYIFVFKRLVSDYLRYLYPLAPFFMIMVSYGFFRLYQIKRLRPLIIAALIFNIISSYPVYYRNNGERYFLTSSSNQELIKASLWIQKNIPQGGEFTILADGAPCFYLYRYPHQYNIYMWWRLHNKLRGPMDLDSLFSFMKENKVKYVVWQNDNLCSVTVAPYLENFQEIEKPSGRLMPLKKFEGQFLKALIYEFRLNEIYS